MTTYLEQIADAIRQAVPDNVLPDEDDTGELFLIYAVLALAKGEGVGRADVHDAWVAWMLSRGEGDHESLAPFDRLAPAVQAEDDPFVRAIRQVAVSLPARPR